MIHILSEVPGDAAAIRAIYEVAFEASGERCVEADIVDALRADGSLTLSLVADDNTELVGHVAASPVHIDGASDWYGIGPVAVLPQYQGRGIGERLMTEALAHLEEFHAAQGVVLLGDPAFYTRFGFRSSELRYEQHPLLALSFSGTTPRGMVTYHASFY